MKTAEIFKRLNGTKILIKGNHDNIKRGSELSKCFTSVQDYAELYLELFILFCTRAISSSLVKRRPILAK